MQALTINVQITKNLGNYETIRIGGEWSLAEGENITAATASATNELEQAFRAQFFDPNGERKKVARMGSPEMDALLRRIEQGGVTWEMVQAWYIMPTQKEVNVLRLAIDTNTPEK